MRNARIVPSGVGRGIGVGVSVGVDVAVAVTVDVGASVGVHVGVCVRVGVLVCVMVRVAVAVGVGVAVKGAVGVGVSVGVGGNGVCDGEGVAVGGISTLGWNVRLARKPQRHATPTAKMAYVTRCRIDSETRGVATLTRLFWAQTRLLHNVMATVECVRRRPAFEPETV